MNKTVFLFLSRLDFGGQERFVSRLTEMLKDDSRYKLYVVLLDSSVINYPVNCEILDLRSNEFASSKLGKIKKTIIRRSRFRKLIKKYHPSTIISFGMGPNLLNIISKSADTKVITSIRGFATAERIIKSKFLSRLYSKSNKILCVSKGIKDYLDLNYPIFQPKTVVVYNGYDCNDIYQKSLEDIETQYHGFPNLITVGTLRPEKGYWHIIKAIYLLKESFPDIRLRILGMDYQDNGEKMRKLVKSLNLNSNVELLGWKENPYQYISKSDIYVLSSVREGFPNALVEAMSCKIPVVAADCLTGPSEILCNSYKKTNEVETVDYGVLVPRLERRENYSTTIEEGDKKLAEAIALVAKDKNLAAQYRELAFERAKSFSYEACIKELERIL